MRKLTLNVDGASRGNPGAAGIGVVVSDEEGNPLQEISEFIGTTTNNVAEYTALIRGLEAALSLGAESLEVYADSELLVRQVRGVYKVKAPHLRPLRDAVVSLLGKFRKAEIRHVHRHLNAQADKLASQAAKTGESEVTLPQTPADEGQGTLGL